MTTEQELFWKGEFGKGYMARNAGFDQTALLSGWKQMLKKTDSIRSVLECGSNTGRNLTVFKTLYPNVERSLIEINQEAYKTACQQVLPKHSFNGPILDSSFKHAQFDLVFSCGVMIHINPDDLLANMKKMHDYSNQYILISEYFSRTPVEIEYHGQRNKLFKRDFGKYFLQNFNVTAVDCGFLWSEWYEAGGFDDMTWWLFKKND